MGVDVEALGGERDVLEGGALGGGFRGGGLGMQLGVSRVVGGGGGSLFGVLGRAYDGLLLFAAGWRGRWLGCRVAVAMVMPGFTASE